MKSWIAKGAVTVLALVLLAPAVFAQEEHGEIGVFAQYTRFHNLNNQNFWGLGGRVGFNLNKFVQLEGSMSYDFERNFTTSTPGVTGTFSRSGFRMLDGLFGPKFQTGAGPAKLFGVLKGGFMNFSVTTNPAIARGFTNAVSNVPGGNTHAAFYPGGGVELFAKWFGVRAEIGDEIYWENGAHHNLRVNFGPQFRW